MTDDVAADDLRQYTDGFVIVFDERIGIAREVIADRFQNAIDGPVDIIEAAAVKAVEVITGAVRSRCEGRMHRADDIIISVCRFIGTKILFDPAQNRDFAPVRFAQTVDFCEIRCRIRPAHAVAIIVSRVAMPGEADHFEPCRDRRQSHFLQSIVSVTKTRVRMIVI